jgi:hypothetical protein
MITFCHAAKGGSGVTTVVCTRALTTPGPSLIIDLVGDAVHMLGIDPAGRPGVVDWLESAAPPAHLDDLVVEVTPSCTLIAARERSEHPIDALPTVESERWDGLLDWATEWSADTGGSVVFDAGIAAVPASFVEQCSTRWLVTRACYLSLQRALRIRVRPTGVVLVAEPGRSLTRDDIEASVGAPVVATIAWDIRIARSIDSGLMHSRRLPRPLLRALPPVAA